MKSAFLGLTILGLVLGSAHLSAMAAGEKAHKADAVLLPMVIKENTIVINVSGAKFKKDALAAPPGKCWVWVKICPDDKKTVNKDAATDFKVLPMRPEGAREKTGDNEPDVSRIWVSGPPGAKLVIEGTAADKKAWKFKSSEADEIQLNGKKMQVWVVEVKGLPGAANAQIVPPDPPGTGCWILIDCNPKNEE